MDNLHQQGAIAFVCWPNTQKHNLRKATRNITPQT